MLMVCLHNPLLGLLIQCTLTRVIYHFGGIKLPTMFLWITGKPERRNGMERDTTCSSTRWCNAAFLVIGSVIPKYGKAFCQDYEFDELHGKLA